MSLEAFDLTGRTALVTGASGGIGRATADILRRAGAELILSDVEATCDTLRKNFDDAIVIGADFSAPETADGLAGEAIARAGRIDVLVCNAGIQGPAGSMSGLELLSIEQAIAVNLRAPLSLCGTIAPIMAERGAGSIVLTSSIAGIRGNKAIGLYGITKAAIVQLARNLAVEWGPHGVRANAVSPGLIRTSFATSMMENEALMERRLSLTPLRRIGEADEIASAILFLASDAGGFVTGQNLVVDGGTTISDGN